MATVYCLCGKVAAEKTTYARTITAREPAVVINLDELMLPLFGEKLDRKTFDEKLAVCLNYACRLAGQVLDAGVSVVIDAGFWKKSQRREAIDRLPGRRVRFVYLKIDEAEQLRRTGLRHGSSVPHYAFTPEMLAELNRLFEEPRADEEGIDLVTASV